MNEAFRTLPFNLGQESKNGISKFQWGRRHRAHLAEYDKECSLPIQEMMAICGYRNLNKFQRRRWSWSRGLGKIPLAYLYATRVNLDVLDDIVQEDASEYAQALATLPMPTSFVIKALPAVYVTRPLPETRRIDDLYWFIQKAIKSEASPEVRAYLHWPTLKSLVFAKGKLPTPCYWCPTLRRTKDSISFNTPPARVFTAKVG